MLVKIANAVSGTGRAGAGKERIRHMKVRKEKTLATKMAISLVAGLTAGLLFLFLREHLNSSGQEAVWTTINDLLFQDITAAGASSALGLFYLAGQMFIRALQLVIVPMVFTSITLAIGQISDTSTLGRISFKCIKGFLICSFFALLLACVCGIVFYNMGVFHIAVDGLESVSGSAGSNPLLVVLNVIPSNIASTFSSNTAVLAVVFLAVSLGLCMKTLGEEKTATLRKLIQELNDVVIVFLNFVVSKFGPVAIFMLLTRTFASYGVEHLKPAVAYVERERRRTRRGGEAEDRDAGDLLGELERIKMREDRDESGIADDEEDEQQRDREDNVGDSWLEVRRRSRSTSRPRSRSSAWMRRSPPSSCRSA